MDSIINQSLSNIVILIIGDGLNDEIENFLSEYVSMMYCGLYLTER